MNLSRWVRRNLFATPLDGILTLVTVPLLAWVTLALVHWAVAEADWDVVTGSLKVLVTGVFPAHMLGLAWAAASIMAALFGLGLSMTMPLFPGKKTAVIFLGAAIGLGVLTGTLGAIAVVAALAAAWAAGTRWPLLHRYSIGIAFGSLAAVLIILAPAGAANWGGLLLSLVLTLTAGLLTIPLGVLLAFGRQSRIASIRILSSAFIETMRSVPLILVVYCIWVAFPLLLPSWPLPDVVRGLIGFVVFYSAYAAEFIRSGLQFVARGQREAAISLGFSDGDIKRLIILPQALRVAMPGLVGNILDIFNFAPLVFIIGLTDFLRAGQMVLANPENSGRTYEVYAFMFLVYFVIGSALTLQARRLERQLGKGARV